jgi:hypothetical protein
MARPRLTCEGSETTDADHFLEGRCPMAAKEWTS